MPLLKYRNPADGTYLPLTNKEEVTVSASPPPVPTDLWVNTADNTGGNPKVSRNVIRNGDMSIAQRGDGPITTGYYLVDGQYSERSGGTVSVSRVVQAPGLGSPLLRIAVSGQSGAATDKASTWWPIEDVNTLSGQQVVLSFDAFAASGTPKIGIIHQQYFGSGGSASQIVGVGTITISTTRTRYSITFTLPSVVGKTLGTPHVLYIGAFLSAGSNYPEAGGIGVQNNVFSITDVQLEEGAIASPFERLPVQQQLAWCQRYFQRQQQGSGGPTRHVFGTATAATAWSGIMPLPVAMRAFPTVSVSGGSNNSTLGLSDGSGYGYTNATFSSWQFTSVGNPNPSSIGVQVTGGTGGNGTLQAFRPYHLEWATGSTTGYIDLSAEL